MKRSHDYISSIPKDINKRVRVAQAGYNNYAPIGGNSMSYGATNNDIYSQYSNQYMNQQMQIGSSMAMVGMSNLGGQYTNPNAMAGHFQHGGAPDAMGGYAQQTYGQMGQFHQTGAQQFGGPQQHQSQMRTIYIGNLPAGVTVEEVMNNVKGGIVEQVKILEDKNCAFITFVEATSAFHFMTEAQTKRINFNGQDAKIGWGKASACPPMIQTAVAGGATRNVFIGSVDETMTDAFLHAELSKFGPVDQVKILQEKRIAFVHMANIKDALTAVMTLQSDPKFRGRRIHYGKDRCAYNNQPVLAMGNGFGGSFIESTMGTQNRTVYLGGIHPEATTKDICDVIRGGILQTIKYMPDKNYAFVTFVDPGAALALVNRGNHEGVVIKGKRVKVAWGKASALPMNVATVVQGGASRNVYIGNTDANITEERLRRDFSEYGEIELINLIPDRNIGFVNFTDILSAVRAVEGIKNNPEYSAYKIAYGKDRCGNPPRPRPENAGAHAGGAGAGGQMAGNPAGGVGPNGGVAPGMGSSAVVLLPTVDQTGAGAEGVDIKVEGQQGYMY
ncbi:hypothetical protein HDU96_002878 [Phlyctochytrium bullatum]|nr:hypothetical protein HDU96_002878 [Phlyctochytrium bullatum]